MARRLGKIPLSALVFTGVSGSRAGESRENYETASGYTLPSGWTKWAYRVYPAPGIYEMTATLLSDSGRIQLVLSGGQFSHTMDSAATGGTKTVHFVTRVTDGTFIELRTWDAAQGSPFYLTLKKL